MKIKEESAAPVQYDRSEILHLLKYGRDEEVREYVAQQKREYTSNFVQFMDQMLEEHKVSRKNVAIRSGLSQDYTYKLLRGAKHTDERDYILAICFAVGMNLAQTQHALSCYGMPQLSERDVRSHVIILAMQNHDKIEDLNLMLENAHFPLLKTSPDMPSAVITDTAGVISENAVPVETVIPEKKTPREFEEIEDYIDGHHNGGNAPFDYDYQGWIRIQDEQGQIYQVEAVFASEFNSFTVFTDEKRKEAERLLMEKNRRQEAFYEKHKNVIELENTSTEEDKRLYNEYLQEIADIPEAERLEYYESLEEAAGSEFFPWFLELDKRTDKKVAEVMAEIDDTRNSGIRVGAGADSNGLHVYIEEFNRDQPERREYYQVRQYSNGTKRFTASHESVYMRMEMPPELYEIYFGKKKEPEYFIDTDKNDFSGDEWGKRIVFNRLLGLLHANTQELASSMNYDEAELEYEKIEYLSEISMACAQKEKYQEAAEALKQVIDLLESQHYQKDDKIFIYVCTCGKLAAMYQNLGNDQEEETCWDKVIALKEDILSMADQYPEDCQGAVGFLAEAYLHRYNIAYNADNRDAMLTNIKLAKEITDNPHYDSREVETIQIITCIYATIIEDEDLDQAVRSYRKAITIARNHHLDQNQRCANLVFTSLNNYAWVLWNKLGSEEAIIYYGKAIDLAESYLFSGIVGGDKAREMLEHAGNALLRLYRDTSREREANDLKERLQENNIKIE